MSDHATAHKPGDAEQLTKQRHVDDGIATKPKLTNRAGPTGDDYIDRGAVCDRGQGPDCFLDGEQRARLIASLKDRITNAKVSFLAAAGRVRMDKLVENDSDGDLSWIALMLLDIATAHLTTLIAGSITMLKNASAKRFAKVRADDALYGAPDHGLGFEFVEHLTTVSEATIKGVTKQIVDTAKRSAMSSHRAAASTAGKTRKQERISYLDQFADATAKGFQTMSDVLPRIADDTTLLAFFQSFDGDNHAIDQYQEAIAEKLARFEASGVTQIGRNPYHRKHKEGAGADDVVRDVRVVWVDFMSGAPRRLAFEHHDLYYVTPSSSQSPPSYGDGLGYTKEPERGFTEASGTNWLVPDEFVELALERHEQVWRVPPTEVPYDDSDAFIWGAARAAKATEYKRRRGNVAAQKPTTPATPTPAAQPPPQGHDLHPLSPYPRH